MKDRYNVIFASKSLKLLILTVIAAALFFGSFLGASAQNINVNSAKQKISDGWHGIKGEWQKEIIEMKQDIAEHWRKLKEKLR